MATHLPFGRGADFVRAWNLGRVMALAGHSVEISAANPVRAADLKEWPATDNLRIGRSAGLLGHRARGLDPFDAISRYRRMRSGGFDVIHTFGARPSVILPAAMVRSPTRPVWVADWSDHWGYGGIASEREGVTRLMLGLIDHISERSMVQHADGLTVVSAGLRRLAEQWGASSDRILDAGVAASISILRPVPAAEARREHGLPQESLWLIYTGMSSFDDETLRQLLPAIVSREAKARLLLVGRAEHEWDRILGGSVWRQWAECRRHVPYWRLGSLYACADVVLMPLPASGAHDFRLPLRLGDSMAAGRPVVTNEGTEAGRLVSNEGFGVAAAGGPEGLAEAAIGLLRDPARAQRLGQRGRRLAEQRHSWEIRADELIGFYRELLAMSTEPDDSMESSLRQ